ncbi:MAG: hypothetical protein A3B91_00955 [Candidatus Yanofskybacteria bacterium RIFCSPHIGHO2_02_FULL_41_29]|uniref:Uncharacterized protein n=1 Tax=Candidatus Yanofskybacteria bacterium RIFCSPHIGHO2_01_FULL_41_53 TaxID=1802663 RepID=A0A1F8EHC5_9BACT|nr:MAG: hypothetical protein A2650_02515 [Candidatus Yanofskybacteria bacterium RIFCSPHIGHO2_01_FULL_41_53]OGN11416.1 MAG: hypothetical protein A3B91_00955 [Candidatus Yanofskybacteria bacterium RIFCSPHIGHO2_02_FULL_41_29]OGN19157.1 MAG: hypothetical protein A3F48_01740 [Candidatus Yanofskybacteria bacterium RIFCSPHIGHO2_12_FULL_41_9]OGN21367.1 MAG: hypothetical protein A2916_03845 [Candidatus Yanofskybacteria bacterium RIFCSPLOWO2_01_FULL_41_67]OGN28844.1 MAG: hypothetical protein A3H54_01720 
MPFEAYKIYEEYEPDKYKTSTQKKVEQALDTAKKEGLVPEGKEVNIEFQEAEEILGKDFLGPEAVQATFNVELTPEELQEIENIPFTREDLEQAKQLGMMLVLRVPRLGEGKTERPLTMDSARELFAGGDTLGDPKKKKQKVFYGKKGESWYDNEGFATQETPKLGWGLVMKSVLPDSLDKNWDQQEDILKKWAKDNNIDPTLVKRRTPVEIAYDTLIYYGANKESLLEGKYDWSGVQSSDGNFVNVGAFVSDGLSVNNDTRDNTLSHLGVCPSR